MADRHATAAARAAHSDDPLVGREIDGRYRIVEPLGAGGMGRVYLAVQLGLEREVALKVLPSGLADPRDLSFLKRFYLEAAVTARLRHPNTVVIFDHGRSSDDGIFYIAMEYLQGRTLAALIEREGALKPQRVIRIVLQIARAIREAHNLGLVHRDLKPSNVMVIEGADEPDFIKVLDFGLAKFFGGPEPDLSQTGSFLGSPHFMAPEQARSEKPTPQSDVYSLGVIAYQLATGRLPWNGQSPIAVLLEQQSGAPKRPRLHDARIPEALEAVILRAMERDLDQRYRSMDELIDALTTAGDAVGVPHTEEGLTLLTAEDVAKLEETPRMQRLIWRAAIATGALAAIASTWLWLR